MSSEVPTSCEVTKMEHALCIRSSGVMNDACLFTRHNCWLQFPWSLKMAAVTGINKKAN